MKYIKLFEKLKKEPKRYLLEESGKIAGMEDTSWYYIWEIRGYDEKDKIYSILKRYTLTPWLKLINEYGEEDEQTCDKKQILDDIIMQSDNIHDLLDELQLLIDTKKYNL